MKGSYVLLIRVPEDKRINVGRLGELGFQEGYYAYVGSAMNNLERRVERHLRKEKNRHWHIDYLLEHAEVEDVLYMESEKRWECRIAQHLKEHFSSVKGFGCGDCGCRSHLFHSTNVEELKKQIRDIKK
ncbi:MAG: GIY-YIG nuclease family protein [Candidatus Altiarchaeota archaeon]|nr:GIY-YIG nuclease family protein [Candidatus Altiarchaeota archaeon]